MEDRADELVIVCVSLTYIFLRIYFKKKELNIIELIHEFKCQGRTLGLFLLHIMNGSWVIVRSSSSLSLGRRGVEISLV